MVRIHATDVLADNGGKPVSGIAAKDQAQHHPQTWKIDYYPLMRLARESESAASQTIGRLVHRQSPASLTFSFLFRIESILSHPSKGRRVSETDPAPAEPEAPPPEATAAEPPREPREDEQLPDEFELTPELVEEEAIRGDIVLRGAVILLAVLFGWTHLSNTPVLVQIRSGQELAANGFLPPRTDQFFSYTADDRAWVNLSWLSDLLLAGLHAIGGAAVLSVLCAVVSGLAFWLVGRTNVSGAPTWWGSICAALAVVAVFPLLTPGPTLMTVVGLALTGWLLQSGRTTLGQKLWWWLVPVMLLWSNLDPRAYLGGLWLVLYAVGTLLAPPVESQPRPRLTPLLVAIAALLVNPWPLEALRSPLMLIRRVHPLWLRYGGDAAAEYPWLWRPVFDEATTANPGWHLTAAIVLALLMLSTLFLNRRNLDWGELLAAAGLNVLGLAAGVDFIAIAVVNAVIAGLNGQRWYLARCQLEYTLDTRELLFSRAGRAITVFALFAAAYWGVSGWMTGADGRRIGFGFSQRLQANIDGYTKLLGELAVDEFDDHPFHVTAEQGDLLIWLGRRSFSDSRIRVFSPPDAANLYELQAEVAAALRSPDQPLTTPQAIAAWAGQWQQALDEYSVTHVVVPLTDPSGYALWVNLASQGMAGEDGTVTRFWEQTSIAGPAAVLYRLEARADEQDHELTAFLQEHGAGTLIQQTFRQDEADDRLLRGVFPRAPTFYETSLLLPEPEVSNHSRIARHYAMRSNAAQRSLFELIAYCHQVIRHGRRGLAQNPNDAETYLLLGEAYQRLWQLEMTTAGNPLAAQAAERRFYQAVYAYHHASLCRPDAAQPHASLYPLYLQHRDYDLALRHLDRINDLTGRYTLLPRDAEGYSESQQQSKRLQTQLADQLDRAREEVDQAQVGGLEASVAAALRTGCPGYALELLEDDLTLTVASPELNQQYGRLLLVNGRTLDGLEQIERQLISLESLPTPDAAQTLKPLAALANLAADQYERAGNLWQEYGQARLKTVQDASLASLPGVATPGRQGDGWPIFQIMTAAESTGRWIPDWELSRWQMAMTELESGQNSVAEALLEEVLESNPNSLLRPQIAMYLTLLTGQSVVPFLPTDEAPATQRPTNRPPSPALPLRAGEAA